MKILTISPFYEEHGGGIERVAGHLCRAWGAQGHTVVWAATDGEPPSIQDMAVKVVPLPSVNPLERFTGLPIPIPLPTGLWRLWSAVRLADAIVIHDALYLSSLSAMLAARLARKPVVLIQHIAGISFAGMGVSCLMRLAERFVGRPMLASADNVVFISETTREAFAGVQTKRPPRTLFNGVDAATFFSAQSEEAIATRRRLSLPLDRKLVLFVGRFVEKKGLTVIAALAKRRPDLQIALAGNGPIVPERWRLANVTVLRGLSGQKLAALYRAADVLLLPSVGEGYPLVIQEAMACGLPVVCGADTARADPRASEWLCPVPVSLKDPQTTAQHCANAIDVLSMNAEHKAAMSAFAHRHYSWSAMASALTALMVPNEPSLAVAPIECSRTP